MSTHWLTITCWGEAGGAGSQAAAKYIIKQLKSRNVKPAGDHHKFTQTFRGRYRNILAVIPGSDPELREDYIVIGAHYDHVGYGSRYNSRGPIGKIHNGADDNASGSAALLGLAQLFHQEKIDLKRSVLLAFWDAEEKGLLGSEYWVQKPTRSLGQVALYINLDMVGRLRNQRIHVFGSRTHLQARRILSLSNHSQLHFDFDWNIAQDSDHYSFFAKGIPFLMLTTDRHQDYHRPSDDADKLNYKGLTEITKLVSRYVMHHASRDPLPSFRKQCRSESEYDHKKQIAAQADRPARLGIRWDNKLIKAGNIVISTVTPESPADIAGLKPGDRIDWFQESQTEFRHALQNGKQFRWLINRADSPIQLGITRAFSQTAKSDNGNRERQKIVKTIELKDVPRKLGISWRADSADPQCVIISRVVPDTPADWANLEVADRIYRIGDNDFKDEDHFRLLLQQQLKNSPAQLQFLVERHGMIEVKAVSFKLNPPIPN